MGPSGPGLSAHVFQPGSQAGVSPGPSRGQPTPLASSRSAASTAGPGLGSLPPEASVSHLRGLRDITHVTRLIPWIPGPTCGEDLACVASWCFDYSFNV